MNGVNTTKVLILFLSAMFHLVLYWYQITLKPLQVFPCLVSIKNVLEMLILC